MTEKLHSEYLRPCGSPLSTTPATRYSSAPFSTPTLMSAGLRGGQGSSCESKHLLIVWQEASCTQGQGWPGKLQKRCLGNASLRGKKQEEKRKKKNTHERVSRKYRASCKYGELFRKEVRRRQENMETQGVSSMAGSGAQQESRNTSDWRCLVWRRVVSVTGCICRLQVTGESMVCRVRNVTVGSEELWGQTKPFSPKLLLSECIVSFRWESDCDKRWWRIAGEAMTARVASHLCSESKGQWKRKWRGGEFCLRQATLGLGSNAEVGLIPQV